jgi:hypothetical protein
MMKDLFQFQSKNHYELLSLPFLMSVISTKGCSLQSDFSWYSEWGAEQWQQEEEEEVMWGVQIRTHRFREVCITLRATK